jgi:hypothetical protein
MSGNFLAKRDALIYFSDVITIIELNMLATLFEHHLIYIFMSGEHAAGQERGSLSCRWNSWNKMGSALEVCWVVWAYVDVYVP